MLIEFDELYADAFAASPESVIHNWNEANAASSFQTITDVISVSDTTVVVILTRSPEAFNSVILSPIADIADDEYDAVPAGAVYFHVFVTVVAIICCSLCS